MAKQLHLSAHPSQLNLKPVTTEMLLELFPFGKAICRSLKPQFDSLICTTFYITITVHCHSCKPPPSCALKPHVPSGMILNSEMLIVAAGNNLIEAWSANNDNKHPNLLIGSKISQFFKLRRPTGIVFDFTTVRDVSAHRRMNHTNL